MAYRHTDNTEQILSERRAKVSLLVRFGIEGIHREAGPNTPKKHGLLRANVRKQVMGPKGKITWGQNYAWYQERGYTSGPVKRYTTPGTNGHFAENAALKVDNDKHKYFRMVGL